MQLTLNSKQAIALVKAVGMDRTIIIRGEAGIGKTAMLYALAEDPDFAGHHIVNPIDCTQMSDGSIWVPDLDREMGVSRELPNVRFGVHNGNHREIDGSQPVLVFLDEIAKAKQSIKDALAPVLYEHRLGEHYMPKGSIVFAATNLSAEGLGDSMQPHMRDRIKNIRMLMAEFNDQVAAFVAVYPSLITAQAMALGDMFKRDDFPSASEIAAKFNVSLDIEPVPCAGDFRVDVGNDALAELQASLTRTNSSREAAMLADITKRVSDHLERMADRLVSETDLKTGDFKQKRFHDTLVTNAYDLCSLVKSLPALQGHAIDKAAAALEKALGGTTAQTLRDDYAKREDVRKAVNELRNQFDL